MLTKDQVLEAIKAGRKSQTLDGRDFSRLAYFFEPSLVELFGFRLVETAKPWEPKPWTREEILKSLSEDLAFGFEKALNKRGISSDFMYNVVKMWLWILEDDLQQMEDYAMYGLPLFKAVAVKYELPNPIGDDRGIEDKYNAG